MSSAHSLVYSLTVWTAEKSDTTITYSIWYHMVIASPDNGSFTENEVIVTKKNFLWESEFRAKILDAESTRKVYSQDEWTKSTRKKVRSVPSSSAVAQ